MALFLLLSASSCVPTERVLSVRSELPESFPGSQITEATELPIWSDFFADKSLSSLIQVALEQNQELSILLERIKISQNQAYARSGAYLPFVELGASAGTDKVGRFTRLGALEESLNIERDKGFPEPLQNYSFGLHASWQVDIWNKLRNLEKAALMRFLSSTEARNLLQTFIVSEVANAYYELLGFDAQLKIVERNIAVQENALKTISLEKQGARVTELAFKRFRAQLLATRSLRYGIQQHIVETENKINFLLGRFPQLITRDMSALDSSLASQVKPGVPSQMLQRRPDIRQAEMQLAAAKLEIEAARANFFPSLSITGEVGLEAYKTHKLLVSPDSLLYALGGSIFAPLINRREIEAEYGIANAEQRKSVWEYERTVLNALIEVSNSLANIQNLSRSLELKSDQVKTLEESIEVANILYRAARADYMEVLLTQRETLEAEFDLIELQVQQKQAAIMLYQQLGGGWTIPDCTDCKK